MTLLERVSKDYQTRVDKIAYLLNAQANDPLYAKMFSMCAQLGGRTLAEYSAERDQYQAALDQHRFSESTRGYKKYGQYSGHEITDTRYLVWYRGRNRHGVEELTLKSGDDVQKIWYLPYRDQVTYPHDQDRIQDLDVSSISEMDWFYACLFEAKN